MTCTNDAKFMAQWFFTPGERAKDCLAELEPRAGYQFDHSVRFNNPDLRPLISSTYWLFTNLEADLYWHIMLSKEEMAAVQCSRVYRAVQFPVHYTWCAVHGTEEYNEQY